MRSLAVILALSISFSQVASAQPGIRNEPVLDEGLFTVGLAHQIRKYCPNISPRMFRAIGFLRDLEKTAKDLGYDEGEIRRHLDSDVEKERMLEREKVYMDARGYERTEEGYCALGRAEIAQKSDVGALLRLKK